MMIKRAVLYSMLFTSLASCVPVYQQAYAPRASYYQPQHTRSYAELERAEYLAMSDSQRYAYDQQRRYYPPPPVYRPQPVYYSGPGYYPPPGHRHPDYYREPPRPVQKGEHFYNERGQYCKLTHGGNVICK